MTLFSWSQTAASNNTADSTINWREGQAPSTVNNSSRAMMAAIAKYRDDQSGILNSGGSSTAYTATSNETYTSLSDGITITLRMHTANGASATLNVDSLGAKAINIYSSTALPSATLNSGGIYRFTYDSADDVWYVQSNFVSATTFSDASFSLTDNSDATKILNFQLSGITTSTTRTLTIPDANGTILLDGDIGSSVQAFDADTLKADTADTLGVGFDQTTFDAGTKSSGTFTPDIANGAFQVATNNGAHTLSPPGSDTTSLTMVIRYTNGASAGTVTTSGFTVVDGDSLTTTNTEVFFLYITRINSYKRLTITAMQ